MGQVLAISRYDGRGAITLQDSVKSQHILPFFPNFVVWARRLEELLIGTDAEAEGGPRLPACPAACMPNWCQCALCIRLAGSCQACRCLLLCLPCCQHQSCARSHRQRNPRAGRCEASSYFSGWVSWLQAALSQRRRRRSRGR